MASRQQGLPSGGVPPLRQRDEVRDVAFQTLGFAQAGSGSSVNETGRTGRAFTVHRLQVFFKPTS
jgi:hypothetical protein